MKVTVRGNNKVTVPINEENRCNRCLNYEYCIKRKDTEVCLEFNDSYIKV